MSGVTNSTLARIQKLLAMANHSGSNENEAAIAAQMAQQIAAEHGLELAQIENDTPSMVDRGGKREKTQHDRSAMYRYQQNLMEGVAGAHFCRHLITEIQAESFGKMRKVKRHVLLGRDVHVRSALMVYDYLIDTMDRYCPWQGTALRGRDALMWMDGCATRLVERLRDKRRQMEQESETKRREDQARANHPSAAPNSGNALVLADVYSSEEDYNNDFINGWEPGTTSRRRKDQKARDDAARAQRETKKRELIAAGEDAKVADYIAWGYSREQALELVAPIAPKEDKPETEAQRRKRERQERAWEERYYRQQAKANLKLSNPAYRAGRDKGGEIGLDTQVGRSETRKTA